MLWLVFAILSAVFAGLTTVLGKCGIRKTDSNVSTAIRTSVMFLFTVLFVLVFGKYKEISQISFKTFISLGISGSLAGISWIFVFKALTYGDAGKIQSLEKLSSVLSVIVMIVFYHETENLLIRIGCTVLLTIGILLMLQLKSDETKKSDKRWIIYTLLAIIITPISSFFAKWEIQDIDSTLATSIRVLFWLIISWILVFVERKQKEVFTVEKKELLFIILSGVAIGINWLCYFYAIQKGEGSVVIPIDKMNVVVTVAFSYFFLKEKLTVKALFGLIFMALATVLMAVFA